MGGRGARIGGRYKSYILKEIPGAKMVYPVKSEIGRIRDNVNNSISNQFKDKIFNKMIIEDSGNEIKIEVGTNSRSRTHLGNDIVSHKSFPHKDADKLSSIFQNSSFVKKELPRHDRTKDKYNMFYYFKAQRKNLYFQVARGTSENGVHYYRLYSITKTI